MIRTMAKALRKALSEFSNEDLKNKSSTELASLLSQLRQAIAITQQVFAEQIDREPLEEDDFSEEQLRKANERLRNLIMCIKCKECKRTRLFLPCAHLATCEMCEGDLARCPLCERKLEGIVNVWET